MSALYGQAPKHGGPLKMKADMAGTKAGRDVLWCLSVLWRRRWIPILGFVFGAAIGAWIFLLSGAQYRASAQILLSGKGHQQDVILLKSDPVLADVAGQLKLYQDAWFTRPYWWQRVLPEKFVAQDGQNGLQSRVLRRMSDMIKLEPMEARGLWRVDVQYKNPEMAALIANNVVNSYRAHKLVEMLDSQDRLGRWLGARLENLRGGVVRAQLALADLMEGKGDADIAPELGRQIEGLRQDIAVGQRLYEQSVLRYQDMLGHEKTDMVMVKVVGHASIPAASSPYAYARLIMWLGAVGFAFGFGWVAVRLFMTQGFVSAELLEAATGYPVYGLVPLAMPVGGAEGSQGGKRASAQNLAVHHNISQDPAAVLAESLRSLRVALRLREQNGVRPRTIMFTSTMPDEGKTSLSVMLATVAVKSGERVCVVDCDLRNPSLHKAFGIGNARGLTDYLSDKMGVDEVIHRRDPSGVHLITAKAVPSYSLSLLTSGRMERLIANLREQYDLVILDAPSSLAFADAKVLANMVDQSLYVVQWNKTPRRAVLASLKGYADLDYDPLALVLNKVEMGAFLRDTAASVVYRYGSVH